MSQPSCKTWNSVEQKLQHNGPGPGSRYFPKSERGLGKKGSEVILRKTGSLVKVGSGEFYIRLWSIRILARLSMEASLFSLSSLRCM